VEFSQSLSKILAVGDIIWQKPNITRVAIHRDNSQKTLPFIICDIMKYLILPIRGVWIILSNPPKKFER
jgi:hypothetical protein